MRGKQQTITYQKQIEFLLIVLDAEEKRRNAVENKSSILIASNAILLSGMISVITSQIFDKTHLSGIQLIALTILTLACFSAVLRSIWLSTQVFASFASQKQRSKIMDLGPNSETEHNLFLFTKIAGFKKSAYQQEIMLLNEQKIFEQLLSQVHNLARILDIRYKTMNAALRVFLIAVVGFAALVFCSLFIP